MAQDAELNIKSGTIKQATTALDKLVEQFTKLAGVTPKVDKGLKKTNKEVKEFGETTNNTGKKVRKGAKDVDRAGASWQKYGKVHLAKATKQMQLIDGPLGGVASRMSALNGILSAGALGWAGLALSAALAFRAIGQGIAIAANTEVAMKTFEAQIMATGHSAGQTAEELDTLSRSMAMSTLDSTEDMRKLVGVMLTFKSISGEAFTEATKLAQDMGKALQQDAVTSARTLGKVLNNPLKNYKALSRAGIIFTDVQQAMIKKSQLNNDLLGAQRVILDKLQESYGGVAAAQAEATLHGQVDTLGQEWEELREVVGERLLPLMLDLATATTDVVSSISDLVKSDPSEAMQSLSEKGLLATDTLGNVETSIAEMNFQLDKAKENTTIYGKVIGSLIKITTGFNADWLIPDVDGVGEVEQIQKELIELELKRTALIGAEVQKRKGQINEELVAYTTAAVEKIALDKRTTDAFLKFGDIRDEGYRREKAAVEALKVAQKLGIEGNEEELSKVAELIFKQSELTEARIAHNTVLQMQKSIQGKLEFSEKEIELNALIGSGVLENTEQYLQVAAAIDLKNRITAAGLDPNSAEVEGLRAQSEALVELQVQLQETNNIKQLGLEFEFDNEGKAQLLTEQDALAAEREEKLRMLDELRRSGNIESETAYREALWKINTEFDKKDADAKKNGAAARKKLTDMQAANDIAGGISAIAGMAKNSKKAAKIQKAMAIFTATQSLVKSLAEAASQEYPMNIAAGLQAAVTGASIISQARSLQDPSFAFGGVDINGEGTGRSDSINARIASGESVMTQAATARHKDTLERMNAGLPVSQAGGNVTVAGANIVIQGDASEATAQLIADKLEDHEARMYQIAQGAAMETIQEENEIGGLLDPI